MRPLLFTWLLLCTAYFAFAQPTQQETVNKLPDFIPPTPEAANILKADNLSVGYVTGSPNIAIPLGSLQTGGYSLGISLNYSSTGVKIDEYASMVGMGWTLNYGGVISRTVMDRPDESRSPGNTVFSGIDMNTLNATLLNFLLNAADKEIDIFTFSFPGYSGKFILDGNYQPVQLARNNLKIEIISGNFQNGFIITTNDGTAYHFQDAEISTNRNPSGENCEKTNDAQSTKTSWYLTKIVLPSKQKEIYFTYTTANITFQSSITQTISRVIHSENYPCTGIAACPVGTERFSTCISQQVVTSKFITKIETSDGDKIDFTYDGSSREDLQNGKRLSSFRVTNRNGIIIRQVTFASDYVNATSGGQYNNKRLFLDSVLIRGGELTSVSGALRYHFRYISPTTLPPRLSYAQDWYGYYNGATSNPSLLPILLSTDYNYATYNNGTGGTSVNFGNRSIDTTYALRGLLNRITYPTGGYDTIIYRAARHGSNQLAGGNAVSKIISYTDVGSKALEREFLYVNKSDGSLSGYLLTSNMVFSRQHTTKTGYYSNSCGWQPVGPSCTYATVTSNSNNPITTFGSQHVYYKSVLEIVKGASTDIGMTEHTYRLFGFLEPRHWLGNYVLNCPYQVLPDIVMGELKTNVYKNTGSGYALVKSTERILRIDSLYEYSSYSVKKNYEYGQAGTPPLVEEFEPFDVDEYYINVFTVLTDTIIEKEYADGGLELTSITKQEYGNSSYTYPTRITTKGSDGLEIKVERKYSPDLGITAMINRNITAPVLEEKKYRNSNLVSTLTHRFRDWFSNGTVIAPDTSDLKFGSNNLVQRILYYGYDTHGNVSEVSKESDQRLTYIWDYNKNYVIAKLQNGSPAAVAYTSFEADGTGGWTRSGTVINTGGVTGYRSFNGTLTKTVSSGNYVVTLWSKTTGSITVNSTTGTQLRTIGSWKLMEWNLAGVTSITVTGDQFDEVRLYPKGALMTTFSYEPQIGVTAQCDVNNRLTYYEYDGLGRLAVVRDQERNVLKTLCYNYTRQPETCDVYYNQADSQSFTRNNCGPDSVGSSVMYYVSAGKYTGYSQDDANAKAQAEIDALGQAYANLKGTCVVACGISNCGSEGFKCVNNECELGLQVFTSVVQVGNKWECTYHYEFSDGSWSQSYVQLATHPSQCLF